MEHKFNQTTQLSVIGLENIENLASSKGRAGNPKSYVLVKIQLSQKIKRPARYLWVTQRHRSQTYDGVSTKGLKLADTIVPKNNIEPEKILRQDIETRRRQTNFEPYASGKSMLHSQYPIITPPDYCYSRTTTLINKYISARPRWPNPANDTRDGWSKSQQYLKQYPSYHIYTDGSYKKISYAYDDIIVVDSPSQNHSGSRHNHCPAVNQCTV